MDYGYDRTAGAYDTVESDIRTADAVLARAIKLLGEKTRADERGETPERPRDFLPRTIIHHLNEARKHIAEGDTAFLKLQAQSEKR